MTTYDERTRHLSETQKYLEFIAFGFWKDEFPFNMFVKKRRTIERQYVQRLLRHFPHRIDLKKPEWADK